MDLASIGETLGIYGGTLVVSLISGAVPLVSIEVYLVALALVVRSPWTLAALVVLATVGQMLAKLALYYAARGGGHLGSARHQARMARMRTRVAAWQRRPLWVLWASATIGLPPLYLVTLAAGLLEIRPLTFMVIGTIGRRGASRPGPADRC